MTLEQIVKTIATELKPEKIILFGSHARGEATPDSDYDLFVIVPIDVIVYPKRQLEQFLLDDGSDFLDNVFNEGKTIYETALPAIA